jgi:peroxiredoxin
MKWNIAVSACCLLLLVTNVALIQQNRKLKAQVSQPPPSMEVPAGTHVPDFNGHDIDGKQLSVSYGQDSRKVLLFVFSPTCGFCAENWPKWSEIIPALNTAMVRPVGVDVSSTVTRDFISQHQLSNMPVVAQADPKDIVAYQLRLTPQTILVDSQGRVERVWSGVLDDSNIADIQRMAGKGNDASAAVKQ